MARLQYLAKDVESSVSTPLSPEPSSSHQSHVATGGEHGRSFPSWASSFPGYSRLARIDSSSYEDMDFSKAMGVEHDEHPTRYVASDRRSDWTCQKERAYECLRSGVLG